MRPEPSPLRRAHISHPSCFSQSGHGEDLLPPVHDQARSECIQTRETSAQDPSKVHPLHSLRKPRLWNVSLRLVSFLPFLLWRFEAKLPTLSPHPLLPRGRPGRGRQNKPFDLLEKLRLPETSQPIASSSSSSSTPSSPHTPKPHSFKVSSFYNPLSC